MNSKVIGGSLLIAGTCVGAVTIVLPLSLLPLGSYGVAIALFATLALVYYSGLILFEVTRHFPNGADLSEMASNILGHWVGILVQLLFLLLLYCLLSAYMTGGSALLSDMGVKHDFGIIVWCIMGLLLLISGIKFQDFLNRLLLFILVISYIVFVSVATSFVSVKNMISVPYDSTFSSLPVLATAFGYHVIIPSIRDYVGDNVKDQKTVLLIGLSIPFLLYLFWCYALYGLLPFNGELGLLNLSKMPNSFLYVSDHLKQLHNSNVISLSISGFMFSSIFSSYIGIAISLYQSLTRNIKTCFFSNTFSKSILVLLPPALFALFQPGGFLVALKYAAIIISIISLIIPVLMVYKLRCKKGVLKNLGLILIFIYASLLIYTVF